MRPSPCLADIVDVWQPSALAKLDSHVAKTVTPELKKIGPIAPELSAAKLVDEVVKRSYAAWDASVAGISVFPKPPTEAFGTIAWMTAQAAFEEQFTRIVESGAAFDAYLTAALVTIDAAFAEMQESRQASPYGHGAHCTCWTCAQQPANSVDPLRLCRFKNAHEACKRRYCDAYSQRRIAETAKVKAIATGGVSSISAICGTILAGCSWPAFVALRSIPGSSDLLTEDPETAAARRRLQVIIANTAAAREVVARIDDKLGARRERRVPIKWQCRACSRQFTTYASAASAKATRAAGPHYAAGAGFYAGGHPAGVAAGSSIPVPPCECGYGASHVSRMQ